MVDYLDSPCHKTVSTDRYDLHEQSGKRNGQEILPKQYYVQ